MATEMKDIDTDSDAESFDTIPETPSAVSDTNSTITIKDASETVGTPETPTPSSDLEILPPPRTNNSLALDEQSSASLPINLTNSIINLTSATVSNNGTPGASSSTAAETSSPASQPKKRRKLKSVPKNTLDNTLDGSDDKTPVHGNVLEFGSNEEITRRVAFPAKILLARSNILYKDTWAFQKVFGYDDFFASGFVFIQANGAKTAKNTIDNAYVFLVLEGTVETTIHQTSYVISQGGLFQVPRGNIYSIKNISNRDAKLFFVQARKVQSAEEAHAGLLTSHHFKKPSSDASMILHWLLPRLMDRFLRLRAVALDWYQKYLAKYGQLASGRRLYLLFFILGLVVRRLPFIGSPPILNIQLVRYS